MLVLSRQQNESIVIDGTIVVTIVEIHGDRVRLGIEAPPEVAVHRQEIQELLLRQNRRRGTSPACVGDPSMSVDSPPSTDPPVPTASAGLSSAHLPSAGLPPAPNPPAGIA